MSDFAEILANYRKRAGYSQHKLSQLAHINSSHLNRLEKAQRNPPKKANILKLAEVLNLNPEERDALLISAGYITEGQQVAQSSDILPYLFKGDYFLLARSYAAIEQISTEVLLQGSLEKEVAGNQHYLNVMKDLRKTNPIVYQELGGTLLDKILKKS